MKATRINRKKLIEFLIEKTKTIRSVQQTFTGKNIYFLTDKDKDDGAEIEKYQVEFVSDKRYLFTILIRGIYNNACFLHDDVVKYVKSLDLDKSIVIDTEYKQTIV
jgi:hypothetical protein